MVGTPIRGKTHAASLDGTEAVPLSPDSFTTTQEIADLGVGSGFPDFTVAPNDIAGSGTMAEIVLPSNATGVAIRVDGEAKPRLMIGVDGEGVIYFGNGVDDPEVASIALGSVYDQDQDDVVPTFNINTSLQTNKVYVGPLVLGDGGLHSAAAPDPFIGLTGTAPNESWQIAAGGTDGFIVFIDQIRSTSQLEFSEMGDPGTGPGFPTTQADAISLFARDNGAGKSEMAIADEDGLIAPLLRLFPTLPADADVPDSGLALALDDTPGATRLRIKAKDANGTVRAGSIALT